MFGVEGWFTGPRALLWGAQKEGRAGPTYSDWSWPHEINLDTGPWLH